jgi:SAM-dependent methyltransferase
MREVYKRFFDKLWNLHDEGDALTVGWGSEESQSQRFAYLLGVGEFGGAPGFAGKSVLDVGCGLGDLLDFTVEALPEEERPKEYVGIDLMERTVQTARERHPDVEFIHGDVTEHEWKKRQFDYVVASGIFSLAFDGWNTHVRRVVEKMFDLCRVGVAVNFLSSYHPKRAKESEYANPATTLDLLMRRISRKAVLRHDYRTNDFTIYLYRGE